MTRSLILTNTTVPNGNGVTVAADFDSVYVAAGASLIANSTIAVDGIHSARAETVVDVAGFVLAYTAIAMAGSNARVTIYDGGAASGDNFGAFFSGINAQLINYGAVSGLYAVYASEYARVTNHGLISGGFAAVSLDAGGRLVNDGDIVGTIGVLANGAVAVANHGNITGTIAFQASSFDDSLINTGRIYGSVSMGLGVDLIDTIAGRIDGSVSMGEGDDTYQGGAGVDIVSGDDGNDDLSGGAGRDRFIAGNSDGDDDIDGGTGVDTYDGHLLSGAITVNLAAGIARSAGSIDSLTGIEDVIGGTLADRLTGDSLANRLQGQAGNDALDGGIGNDVLFGGAGNDSIIGGVGNDRLFGGEGVDRLYGGDGNDVLFGSYDVDLMTGGAGADRFDFNEIEETFANAGTGRDRILDFVNGLDVIDLSTMDAVLTAAGDQAFSFIGTAAITDYGQLSYRFVGGATYISVSVNSPGRLDIIRLDGEHIMTAADFIL
ncbi:calcium-binding protein [Cypionkella sp. TWP1-2-1b2]|uniref:calcium-binding protein n=1 Tax=Cypionkella sp. TWP1-2-1b2 TaxID=2804675 RepID=UPI003CEE84AE